MAYSSSGLRPGSLAMLIKNPDEFNRTFDSTLGTSRPWSPSTPTPRKEPVLKWPTWNPEAEGVSPESWAREVLASVDPAYVSGLIATAGSRPEKATTMADLIDARDKIAGKEASRVFVDDWSDIDARDKLAGKRITTILSDDIEAQKEKERVQKRKRIAEAQTEARNRRIESLGVVAKNLPDKLPREMRVRMGRFGDVDSTTLEIGLKETLHLLEFRRDVLGYDNHARYRYEMESLAREWGQELHNELVERVMVLSGAVALRGSDAPDELPDGLEELLEEEAKRSYGSAAVRVW